MKLMIERERCLECSHKPSDHAQSGCRAKRFDGERVELCGCRCTAEEVREGYRAVSERRARGERE